MVEQLLQQLATTGGPVGISLGIAYLYIRQLHKELREVEDKRVKDQQAMVSKLLELNDKWNETINSQIEVSEAQKVLLSDVKTMLIDRPRR